MDFGEMGFLEPARFQRFREDICCHYSVLNGVIDTDASDGRHHVRGISNEQQALLMPTGTEIGFNGEKRNLLPIVQVFGILREARLDFRNGFAEGFHSLSAQCLIVPFGEYQSRLPMVGALQNDEDPALAGAAKRAA